MKTRQGFVSNSSSCSFTCCVCSNVEGGYDSSGRSEFGFSGCTNGHEFCEQHLLPESDVKLEGEDDHEDEDDYYGSYADADVNPNRCPICTMTSMDENLKVPFLLKQLGWKEEDIMKQVKIHCKTYTEVQNYVKK